MHADVIDPVIKVLRQTLTLAAQFDHTQQQRSTLRSVLRKLMVIRELHSTSFVSVTGTQGAGKTRLLKEIYGLDGWLDDNAGRGEKRPLFVLECDCNEPKATGVTAEGLEVPLNRETLTRELRSFSDAEQYLLLRLYVPRQYFDSGFGFLLLPGYERLNRDNQLWQHEMRDTLRHSMGSILVTDQTRMADRVTTEILDDLMKQCFESRAPIIAISRTEGLTEAQREALRASASEVCQVDAAEMSRVICTGVGDELRKQWLPALITAVRTYTRPSREVNRQRLEDLSNVVDVELEQAFTLLEQLISEVDGRGRAQSLLINEMMARFRKSSDTYRRRFERQLREHSSSYAAVAARAAQKDYADQEQGLMNKLGNFFTGDDDRFIKRIEQNWQQQGERTPLDVTYLALSDMANRNLQLGYKGGEVPSPDQVRQISEQGIPALLGYEDSTGTVQLFGQNVDPAQLQRSLRLLLQRNPSSEESLDRQMMESREITHALELIPTLSMEYLRVAHAAVLAVGPSSLPSSNVQKVEPETVVEQIKEALPKIAHTTQDVMKTILSIGAVDLAIDGTLHLPAIVAGGGAAGVGATLSGVAAGVITLAFLGHKVIQTMHQYDREQKNYISFCMDHLASHQLEKTLLLYDDVIEQMEQRLVHNLELAYGVDHDMFSERDALARAVYALQIARRDLTSEIDRVQQRYLA